MSEAWPTRNCFRKQPTDSHRCESGNGYFLERPLLPAAPNDTMPNR